MNTKTLLAHVRQIAFIFIVLATLLLPLLGGPPDGTELLASLKGNGVLGFIKELPDFASAYTRLFNHYYRGHDTLVRAYNRLQLDIFHKTVFPTVLVGKDGWLFWTGENSMEDFQNIQPFIGDDLKQIQAGLDGLNARLNAQGIHFLVVVAPNKTTLYPEYLPENIHKIGPQSRLDQLMGFMNAHGQTTILDLRPALESARQERQIYHATDSHWNDYGALVAANEIIGALHPVFPSLQPHPLADYTPVTETFTGDLARLLLSEDHFRETTDMLEPRFTRRFKFLPPDEESRVITIQPDEGLPRAVIFRDSFAMALIPFLSDHFSQAVYVWDFNVDEALIAAEKPDVVILEMAERYLDVLKTAALP